MNIPTTSTSAPVQVHRQSISNSSPLDGKTPLLKDLGLASSQRPWMPTIIQTFHDAVLEGKESSDSAITLAVITALARVLQLSTASTMHNLQLDIRAAVACLKNENKSIEVKSSCELFQAYVTRTWADLQDFDLLKSKFVKRGEQFRANVNDSGRKIAKLFSNFVRDNMVILTHGHSPIVNTILLFAMEQGKRFKVIFTSAGSQLCTKTVKRLLSNGIHVTVIPDSSVAHIMTQVDIVLVGAFAVVESGGILNQIGTYQMGIVAKALGKPVYCAAQSFKFTRSLYPLTQQDIPVEKPYNFGNPVLEDLKQEYPDDFSLHVSSLDYTPPNYLTLLFTDLGILTPSAVSDELIKLYA